MPILNEFTFSSSDRKNNIYVREWLPDSAPVGVVQIAHGVAEHIERYDDFARYLAEGRPAYVPLAHLSPSQAVTLLRRAGATSRVEVSQHPFQHTRDGSAIRLAA